MTHARLSPRAEWDLERIFDAIAADNASAARRVRDIILDTADLLARYPEVGRKISGAARRHGQIRWFVVPRFRNYILFYQPFQDTILVVRVLHAAQDWTRHFSG